MRVGVCKKGRCHLMINRHCYAIMGRSEYVTSTCIAADTFPFSPPVVVIAPVGVRPQCSSQSISANDIS